MLNTLLGLRNDFAVAIRALAATQAGLVVVLASLAPLTALWYFAVADHPNAVLNHVRRCLTARDNRDNLAPMTRSRLTVADIMGMLSPHSEA